MFETGTICFVGQYNPVWALDGCVFYNTKQADKENAVLLITDFEFNKEKVLTDFVHGSIKCLQFGAASQEGWRNTLHTVLAHIKQLDFRQTPWSAQLSYTVTEKRKKNSTFLVAHGTHIVNQQKTVQSEEI